MNNFFEWFKLGQRMIMVILTVSLLLVMNKTANNIADMKLVMYQTNETISKFQAGVSDVSKAINYLHYHLDHNWLLKAKGE